MKYTLKRPCSDCPFLRKGGIKLSPGRIEEIAGMMLDSQGGTFPCHKTTVFDDDTEEQVVPAIAQHCAGALIFADKNDTHTQMMRIVGRLGLFNPDELEGIGDVWDNTDEWLEGGML